MASDAASDAGATFDVSDDIRDAHASDTDATSDTVPSEDVAGQDVEDTAETSDTEGDPADTAMGDADAADANDGASDTDALEPDTADAVSVDTSDTDDIDANEVAEDTAPVCELGARCDDGDPCTSEDECTLSGCVGQALDCSAFDTDCSTGICVEGSCEGTNAPNGLACTDADLCTTNDICFDGVCGGDTVVCESEDSCTPEVCEPSNGTCIPDEALLDGTPCDDNNTCTVEDVCDSGVCSSRKLPDGDPCDDGTSCTESDECFDGVCTADPVIFCDVFFDPCVVGACVDIDGEPRCTVENVEDGVSCDEASFCSLGSCTMCVADGSDPQDDSPPGAATSESFGEPRSLCPDDVDHFRISASAARTAVLRVDSDRCGDVEGFIDDVHGDTVDARLPSTVSFCPLFEVQDRQVLRLQSDTLVQEYTLARGDFIPDSPLAVAAESAIEIDALGGWSAISSLGSGDERWYVFTLAETRIFTAETGAFYCGVDTLLTLFDESAETVIFTDDDSGPSRCSRISRVLHAGRYFVQARGFSDFSTGTYTMHASTSAAPSIVDESESNDTQEMADLLIAPSRMRATLRTDDVDWFTFSLEEEAEVSLFTEGLDSLCDVDTMVSLYDASGTLVRTNDDTPSRGLCSEIISRLQSGTYFVEVRGFRTTNTGPYVLDFSAL